MDQVQRFKNSISAVSLKEDEINADLANCSLVWGHSAARAGLGRETEAVRQRESELAKGYEEILQKLKPLIESTWAKDGGIEESANFLQRLRIQYLAQNPYLQHVKTAVDAVSYDLYASRLHAVDGFLKRYPDLASQLQTSNARTVSRENRPSGSGKAPGRKLKDRLPKWFFRSSGKGA